MDKEQRILLKASRNHARQVDGLSFSSPVAYVYNPLVYASEPHEMYLKRYGTGKKHVVFLGMNPGPWGMAQTGVPFGEVSFVRDWLKIEGDVKHPLSEHPKRPVRGFECTRSEVSGRRLWSLMQDRFRIADVFFKDHFIANYCPLLFMEESGKNRTPDKLPAAELNPLLKCCDNYLRQVIGILDPEWVVGIGLFAKKRIDSVLADNGVQGKNPKTASILHPSPASPMANRGWAEQAIKKLKQLGIW